MAQINVNDPKNNSSKSTDWKPEEVPQLTVDVYRSGDSIFVVSTVAGVNPKDLDISVEGNTLSVKGIRRKPYSDGDNVLLLEECFWGEFYRELTINENLDVDRIKATLNQGVLIVEVPILKLSSHRRIEVDMQ
jgi:HSP20 family protein